MIRTYMGVRVSHGEATLLCLQDDQSRYGRGELPSPLKEKADALRADVLRVAQWKAQHHA